MREAEQGSRCLTVVEREGRFKAGQSGRDEHLAKSCTLMPTHRNTHMQTLLASPLRNTVSYRSRNGSKYFVANLV